MRICTGRSRSFRIFSSLSRCRNRRVDRLYVAKRRGRDRVMPFSGAGDLDDDASDPSDGAGQANQSSRTT